MKIEVLDEGHYDKSLIFVHFEDIWIFAPKLEDILEYFGPKLFSLP